MQINPGITRVQVRHPQLANLSDIDEGKGNAIAFLEETAMVKSTAVHWYKVSEIISRRPFFFKLDKLLNEQPASGLRRLCGSQRFLATFYFVPSNQISL